MIYFAALALLVILDGTWLAIMVNRFYRPNMHHLLGETINFIPAVIFYLIYAFAITYFIVWQSNDKTLWNVFLNGALLGLTVYAGYNLTNQATLKDWPSILSIVDISWGTLMTGLVSLGTVWISRKFF